MSSFDSLLASPAGEAGDPFLPLCPSGDASAVESPAGWRPLFDEPVVVAEAAGGATGDLPSAAPANPTEDAAREPAGTEDAASFAAGYEQGQRETRALVEEAAVALGQSVDALGDFLKALQSRYERELLDVALGVARKVVHTEVTERPELWLGMIREALHRVVERETVRIRVPAGLAAFLTEQCPALRAQLDGVQELEVVEDPALPDGACVVETRIAELDAGVDTQLDQITRALGAETPS